MALNTPWELVDGLHLDLNTGKWGPLYRYPIASGVAAGETVIDGWGQPHEAPAAPGPYVLYQYVQDASLQGFSWEADL